MTFQQLEYIVQVDTDRHFVKAATNCGVTQSTLSSSIAKLEQEIDIIIFDRSKHPIVPTPMGAKVIERARIILHNSQQLLDMVKDEQKADKGYLHLGIIPSVSAHLFPLMAKRMRAHSPGISTELIEGDASLLIERLQRSEIDMAVVADTEVKDTNLLQIELYTERFVAYLSPTSPLWVRENLRPEDLKNGDVWAARVFHDHYPQLTDITHQATEHSASIEYSSLATLVGLVDKNGGYTLLPECYSRLLTPEQQRNVRLIQGASFFRVITLVVRHDYMREKMLNLVVDAIKESIPREMLSPRLLKFQIKLGGLL